MTDLSSDEKEVFVMEWLSLQNAKDLEEVYKIIPLTCPTDKSGKRISLLKNLLKHLCELEDKDDQGLSTMLALYDHAVSCQNPIKENKEDKKLPLAAHNANDENFKTVMDVFKLKELKISGIIGGSGEKDKLSYTSLSYQIANAEKSGYSGECICAAVVKAISPGNNLRTYLESKPDLTLVTLLDILRSHFKEKDSASVFTELGNAVQISTENSLEFVIRLMCLRQKVFDLAREEGCPYEQTLLNKRMFHAMFTGLSNANIRVDLRERCQHNVNISDTDLLKFVSEVVANEVERTDKLSKKSLNVIEISKKGDNNLPVKKNNPFVQIEELKITHQKDLAFRDKQFAALKADISELKNALWSDSPKPDLHYSKNTDDEARNAYIPPHRRYSSRKFSRRKKCSKCELDQSPRCFHCFLCGSTDHMMFRCPNKKNE